MKTNIVLTGFMGSGKTTTGKKIAQKLNMHFVDIDDFIEKQQGMTISEIFATHGETYFRDIESKAVEQVSTLDHKVIATGGGVVLKKENIENLSKKGFIIHLKADANTIIRNTAGNDKRPLLNDKDRESKIQELIKQREEYYKQADIEVDVSTRSVDEVVENILEIVKGHVQ